MNYPLHVRTAHMRRAALVVLCALAAPVRTARAQDCPTTPPVTVPRQLETLAGDISKERKGPLQEKVIAPSVLLLDDLVGVYDQYAVMPARRAVGALVRVAVADASKYRHDREAKKYVQPIAITVDGGRRLVFNNLGDFFKAPNEAEAKNNPGLYDLLHSDRFSPPNDCSYDQKETTIQIPTGFWDMLTFLSAQGKCVQKRLVQIDKDLMGVSGDSKAVHFDQSRAIGNVVGPMAKRFLGLFGVDNCELPAGYRTGWEIIAATLVQQTTVGPGPVDQGAGAAELVYNALIQQRDAHDRTSLAYQALNRLADEFADDMSRYRNAFVKAHQDLLPAAWDLLLRHKPGDSHRAQILGGRIAPRTAAADGFQARMEGMTFSVDVTNQATRLQSSVHQAGDDLRQAYAFLTDMASSVGDSQRKTCETAEMTQDGFSVNRDYLTAIAAAEKIAEAHARIIRDWQRACRADGGAGASQKQAANANSGR